MRKLLLITTALLAFTGAASADTYLLQSENTLDNGTASFNVNMPSVNYSNYAGPIELNTDKGSFLAYCMDLFHTLSPGTTYTIGSINTGNSVVDAQIAAAASLGFAAWNAKAAGYELYAEAAQLAIWKLEYGTALNVSIFGSSEEVTDYNSILAAAQGPWANPNGVSAFIPTDLNSTQQMLVQTAVPEPATWMMMILGFAGVGLTAMRRRRNSGPALRLA